MYHKCILTLTAASGNRQNMHHPLWEVTKLSTHPLCEVTKLNTHPLCVW